MNPLGSIPLEIHQNVPQEAKNDGWGQIFDLFLCLGDLVINVLPDLIMMLIRF